MRELFILIGFCVFTFLLGVRLKQRLVKKKPNEVPIRIRKNQRSKMADCGEEPPLVKERRLRRERRSRRFTVVLLFALFGLMIFMIPSLVFDLSMPERMGNLHFFLRCFIFVFTVYVFVLGYIKVMKRKKEE
ncbi:hypothetical protein [Odoribacter lunatus]|uniref:hypothetical protein n=1 Tax=Odoribacter lunatus TaxID=2941335 RepID=UPI00203B651B|nr:hypothetical protein [Odoribacter lunatus]